MTSRGIDFLENWIAKNVTALDPSAEPMRASNLAMRCILDATDAGLTLEEIKPESGSLESHIAEAMAHLPELGTPAE